MADRRRIAATALAVAVSLGGALGVGACAGGGGDENGDGNGIPLDGSPRVPDAEGVVVGLADDFSTLTLDGDRSYEVPEDVQSFSSVDGSTQPLRRRVGQYVHLGLDGSSVEWVAGIAAVVKGGAEGDRVYYTGELRKVAGSRLDFADGTVLRLADGLDSGPLVEAEGEQVLVTIDPAKRAVVAVDPQ